MKGRHELTWRTAAPLWSAEHVSEAPVLLRFTDERFIDDLVHELTEAPERIAQREVPARETWRDALSGVTFTNADRAREPAKLYQPVHGRYYLAAAQLVCRVPGLPDHTVDLAAGERVSLVLRRLTPSNAPGGYEEWAWTKATAGAAWRRITDPTTVLDEDGAREERIPAFPLRGRISGRPRTTFAGLVPVSSRETLQAAPELSPIGGTAGELAGDDLANPALAELDARVTAAFRLLRDRYVNEPGAVGHPEAREALLFALVDLDEVIETQLEPVWARLRGESRTLTPQEHAVWTALGTPFSAGRTFARALVDARALEAPITEGAVPGGANALTGGLSKVQIGQAVGNFVANVAGPLEAAIRALPARPLSAELAPVPKLDPSAGALYAIRFVYERPACAPLHGPVVSTRTRTFQLSSYFDADAPARPLTVTLPVDTSISGLRRFPKAVSFLVSNQLRQQMERVKNVKLKDLDDGVVGTAPQLDLGMICSFSIPIITICALILLMIIVSLLNIVFWWLPFLKICLPLKLEAKS
ncbi:hypothetical protein L6R52_13000 [Myxococcota bacterium]|nr:hypothetical protein [Myxococcota bacterium]